MGIDKLKYKILKHKDVLDNGIIGCLPNELSTPYLLKTLELFIIIITIADVKWLIVCDDHMWDKLGIVSYFKRFNLKERVKELQLIYDLSKRSRKQDAEIISGVLQRYPLINKKDCIRAHVGNTLVNQFTYDMQRKDDGCIYKIGIFWNG